MEERKEEEEEDDEEEEGKRRLLSLASRVTVRVRSSFSASTSEHGLEEEEEMEADLFWMSVPRDSWKDDSVDLKLVPPS